MPMNGHRALIITYLTALKSHIMIRPLERDIVRIQEADASYERYLK